MTEDHREQTEEKPMDSSSSESPEGSRSAPAVPEVKQRDAAIRLLQALPEDLALSKIIDAIRTLETEGRETPPPPLYEKWRKVVSYAATIISGVLACLTIALVVTGTWTKSEEDRLSFFYVYAFWTLAPPLWFFVEYVWIFDPLRGNALRVQDFNTAQGLAQKVWAALLVFLSVFALVLWGAKF
jgi:hypothetical protein